MVDVSNVSTQSIDSQTIFVSTTKTGVFPICVSKFLIAFSKDCDIKTLKLIQYSPHIFLLFCLLERLTYVWML